MIFYSKIGENTRQKARGKTKILGKVFTMMVVVGLLCCALFGSAVAGITFSDVKSGDWYEGQVKELVSRGFVNGYPDGTFRPQANISRAEFAKVLIVATGEKVTNSKTGHWATGYVEACVKKGFVVKGEFDDLDKAITRGEIARMIVRALGTGSSVGNTGNINETVLKDFVIDYYGIDVNYKDFVIKAYGSGIMGGYPDGTFKVQNTATRAEAVVMLMRFLEPKQRNVMSFKQAVGSWNIGEVNSLCSELKLKIDSKVVTHYGAMIKGNSLGRAVALDSGVRSIKAMWSDINNVVVVLYDVDKVIGVGRLENGGVLRVNYK